MTSGASDYLIRKAIARDIDALKEIADAHKRELGFVRRPTLLASINRQELFLAENEGQIIGFIEYHHRRDEQTTLYNIVIKDQYRQQGIGRQLMQALIDEATGNDKSFILLKCPADLESNGFYETLAFSLDQREEGKKRALNIWKKELD